MSRGICIPADEWVDELFVLHQRCPKAVFSHDEVLYYHGLIDREPLIHTFTVYSGCNMHRLTAQGGSKAFYVKRKLVDAGKISVTDNFGRPIPMYDLERTVCDLIRSRSYFEIQDFQDAQKSYIRRKRRI